MKKLFISSRAALWAGVLAIPLLTSCGSIGTLEWSSADAGYTTLFDGSDLNQWKPVGNANWRLQDNLLLADLGSGFLVTRQSYQDFQLKVDFWVDSSANSGIYIRCTDLQNITSANAYEVNIYDQRPDPSFGTGAIVDVAKVTNMPKVGGQWNSYDITFKGDRMVVYLNGEKTVETRDSRLSAAGPIALQYEKGVVRFRNLRIKAL
jgi:hypothetical protein